LFRGIYLLFPTRKFRCYRAKFHCSEKLRFGRKSLKLLARPRAWGRDFSKIRC
jgi:hypothetical protein